MDFESYKLFIGKVKTGKQLPDSIYVHNSALSDIPEELANTLEKIATALKIASSEWNILKLYKRDFKVAFLSYPDFDSYSYPPLQHSFTVDLAKLSVRKSSYENSENPPILHRKETFVKADFELRSLFEEITAEGETIGLYENPRSIGFKKNWERLISNKGYFLDKTGRLQPKASRDIEDKVVPISHEVEVERHRTAIDRNQLSQPMQILARHNYFNGDYSVLDYGCGKGDDMRELEAHGIDISGWDPVHLPDGDILNTDIVNLGFVLNVIEDREERQETLKRAWGYADKLLIVSVMIAGESVIRQFTPYKDGVITSRNTFQRYYTQSEFRSYVESSLDESAIAVGQGIFIASKASHTFKMAFTPCSRGIPLPIRLHQLKRRSDKQSAIRHKPAQIPHRTQNKTPTKIKFQNINILKQHRAICWKAAPPFPTYASRRTAAWITRRTAVSTAKIDRSTRKKPYNHRQFPVLAT